jgi:hypothetical protein
MYIDPNTGGIIFQVLATAFAVFSGAALLFSRQIRIAFARFARFLRDLRGRDEQPSQVEVQSDDATGQEQGEEQ